MRGVLPETLRHFSRALVMPNLVPPVVTAKDAVRYRRRIENALPDGHDFRFLLTLYLTETTDPRDVVAAHSDGIISAVKLYPAGATTNSDSGVRDIARVMPVLEAMAGAGCPLCVHGEVTDQNVDIFDREAVFIEYVLDPLRRALPELKVILEHVTTMGRGQLRDVRRQQGRCVHHRPPPADQPKPHPVRGHPAPLLLSPGSQAGDTQNCAG